jgi:tetratricopeptide (TPR) repeat protein
MRLNPHYPDWYDWVLGMAYYSARRYEETIAAFKRMVSLNPESLRYLAASYAQLGREAEARAVTAEILEEDPEFSSAYWADKRGYKNQADRDHYLDGLRKAGLPD